MELGINFIFPTSSEKLRVHFNVKSYAKGPCSIVDSNSTKFNPYSWNKHANIFFIDQPVGVGYSYADFDEVAVSYYVFDIAMGYIDAL